MMGSKTAPAKPEYEEGHREYKCRLLIKLEAKKHSVVETEQRG
jgi:hypothetical protein